MRLKHIKLAGFKSFVDVTTVPFPDQMTAIVGPNGCGKSNVIDAVRWVLGESSAKNLRGDAMTDVIFNGSTKRKPVSQASVELLFENNEGRLEGNLADRAEISVKRAVNKDAKSTYFLNGTKCRRRDITDIFLGTGLGPRSYAIIEQGMISRLIESKPQELRVFIEEAAGISKYKERRRETENRIKHTRENLLRLEDVREELGAQIEKLKRQAATAKRYKELKTQERKYKAELYALKWHKYNEQLNLFEKDRLTQQAKLDAFIAEQRGGELGLLKLKEQHQEKSDQVQSAQQKNYQQSNQITRIEQQIVFSTENRRKQTEEYSGITAAINDAEMHIELERESLNLVDEEYSALLPDQELNVELTTQCHEQLFVAEQRYENWQQNWEKLQRKASNASRDGQVAKTKLQAHQQQIERIKHRLATLSNELAEVHRIAENNTKLLHSKLDDVAGCKTEVERFEIVQLDFKSQLHDAENDRDCINAKYQSVSATYLNEQGQLASLLSWQETYQNRQIELANNSLSAEGIDDSGPLLGQLTLDKEWMFAVESLVSYMGAPRLVDEFPSAELPGQYVKVNENNQDTNTVASLIESGYFPSYFNQIGLADNVDAALPKLLNDEFSSVLTKSGQWVGKDWLYNGPLSSDSDTGVLARFEQIKIMQQSLELKKSEYERLEIELARENDRVNELAKMVSDHTTALLSAKQKFAAAEMQVSLIEQQQAQQQNQVSKLQSESETATMELEQETEIVWTLEQEFEIAEGLTFENEELLLTLESDKQTHISAIEHAKQQVEIAKSRQHQLELNIQNRKSQIETARSNVLRAEQNLGQLKTKKVELESTLSVSEDPVTELKMQLEAYLELKLNSELELQTQQADLSVIAEQISQLEQGQSGIMSRLDKMRASIESIKLDSEGARIRAQNMLDTLNEMDQALKPILDAMPLDADEKLWSEELDRTTQKISRLGAINLAAIEEYELQSERKGYLDEQFNDLSSALDTLESAIKKIDRESRFKFKQTFEKINDGLQTLFPKVFGGGSAYLTLTADDMLDTGVTIMARPPGKKNSTIHLLSGGEKALTALSLVFSIFQLNPAPFCMLDEVDAPLDDANVSRFCNLVKEMSGTVQFIYISHNKVAMEMATHLTGVTMQEPGVSRLVAVDIQEAVNMAEAS